MWERELKKIVGLILIICIGCVLVSSAEFEENVDNTVLSMKKTMDTVRFPNFAHTPCSSVLGVLKCILASA